jgi:hypothetical protein
MTLELLKESGRPISEKLHEMCSNDIGDRSIWQDRVERISEDRLGRRRAGRRHYPGSPNFLEPIIDDNVRNITSAENSLVWSGSRYLAAFQPLDQQSLQFKRQAEIGFDQMLRRALNIRAKLETLLDRKNEIGMALAKLIQNNDALPGKTIPDFDEVDPIDVVVPVGTRKIRNAERVCHVIRMNEREFLKTAERRQWNRANEVADKVRNLRTNEAGAHKGVVSGHFRTERDGDHTDPGKIGLTSMPTSIDWVIVWEVYYHNEKSEKRVCIFSPFAPDIVLSDFPWEYDPIAGPMGIVIREERPWPFVQFRYENRSSLYYDVRGVGELLSDNQKAATQLLNSKAVQIDFYSFPFVKASPGGIQNFKFRPGERVPMDFEFVRHPPIDPFFEINADRERSNASRRVGAPLGALTSMQSLNAPKTATEVSNIARQSSLLSSDSIMRFTEPLGELFQMMWDYLRHWPVDLPAGTSQELASMPADAIQQTRFLVEPTISGRNANPDFILAQITNLSPILQNNPFVHLDRFTRMLMDQIDPMLTEELVLDPQQPGGGAPMVQQVAALEQALQQISGIVEQHHKYIAADAQDTMIQGQMEKIKPTNGTPNAQPPAPTLS